VTGRPTVLKKALLKFFVIDSLRKLANILDRFDYFRWICGLLEVPHLSLFSRVSQWLQEQRFSDLYAQPLNDLEVQK
jgi:Transposase domain (DUF772)